MLMQPGKPKVSWHLPIASLRRQVTNQSQVDQHHQDETVQAETQKSKKSSVGHWIKREFFALASPAALVPSQAKTTS